MNGKKNDTWRIRILVFLSVFGMICILSLSTVKRDNETVVQTQYQSLDTGSAQRKASETSTERVTVKTSETWTQNEVSRPVKSDPVTSNSDLVTSNSESARQDKQDEYDVYDYSAYEDFYDDHEEDFDGEDDAESYYDDAWGDDAWGDDGL